MKKIIEHYSNYDEDDRLIRHRTEFVTTTYILDKSIKVKSRILDVAAGTGTYSIHYANKGCSVTAIDIVPKHIRILKSKLESLQNLQISAEVGDARDLSRFQANSFEAILCMGPLYHVERNEIDRCISECLRVLRKDGIFAASYVNKFEGYESDKYREFFLCYTPEEIEHLFLDFDLAPILNAPTDGIIFDELNELIRNNSNDLPKLHAWLDEHQSLFHRSIGIEKCIHGLHVSRKKAG